jgi:preprotein translocase subunit SecG
MLYEILLTFHLINCVLLVLVILAQKSKSSMGIGGLGGGTQLLFGGGAGQDLFQKTTWTLGGIFMVSSLLLALLKAQKSKEFQYITSQPAAVKQAIAEPERAE